MSMPKQLVSIVTIATDLVGVSVGPQNLEHVGSPHGTWPVNDPNLSDEHVALVRAAWVTQGTIKLLLQTPRGILFEVYAAHVRVKQ